MTIFELLAIGALGLGAGAIGGLAGIGGSLVMLPGLHLLHPQAVAQDHHLFVAAAMSVNVAVALPAAVQHARAGAVRWDLTPTILLTAVLCIVVGVVASNHVSGDALKLALALFIFGYCGLNVWRLARSRADADPPAQTPTPLRLALSGACAGLTGGILGLGGGVVLVPMLQVLCRIPLRQSIATSSAVICVTATIGAAMKLGTLASHDRSALTAVLLAGVMAPTAIVGGIVGARLTHRLPLRGVRLAVTVLLLAAAVNLVRTSV